MQKRSGAGQLAWQLYERWISEIVADFWSVARVGIASTMGLIGVVSLPSAFVFRIAMDDPHPAPWIRVLLSARIGSVLYPHQQWDRLARTWVSLYPIKHLQGEKRMLFEQLRTEMNLFVSMLVNHRPKALRGNSLREVMQIADRMPERLTALWRNWRRQPELTRAVRPTILFAAVGQARANGEITPEQESSLLSRHLAHWAMKDALDITSTCARFGQSETAAGIQAAKPKLSITA